MGVLLETASLADHRALAAALTEYRACLGADCGRVAFEAARTKLLASAVLCGWKGDEPLLIWAARRVQTFGKLVGQSGAELDRAVKALPKEELAELLADLSPAPVKRSPHEPAPSLDPGCLA